MQEPTSVPAPESAFPEEPEDPAILDRSIVQAAMAVINELDEHSIHPDDYWRIFKAVKLLCDGLEDGQTPFQRGISAINEKLEPMLPMLLEMIMRYAAAGGIQDAPGAPGHIVMEPIGPAYPTRHTAYVLARIVGAEIQDVRIYSEEQPTQLRGPTTEVFATIMKVHSFSFEDAAALAATSYKLIHPELAAKFPLPPLTDE